MRVQVVCTTDDPADDLADHVRIATEGLPTKVYPTFRPDKALQVDASADFNAWADALARVSGIHIARFGDFLGALEKRHAYFHSLGGRLSDHGLPHAYGEECTDGQASAIFDKARAGQDASAGEKEKFASYVGMTTDSRSFLSYTRHEYFRRILCNLLGEDVKRGEIPDDMELLGNLVEDVCYRNARSYFGLALGEG